MGALTKRIVVAVPAIALLIFATFWEHTSLFKLLAVVGLGLALLEYLTLVQARQKGKVLRVEGMIALLLILLPWVLKPMVDWEGWGTLLAGLWILTLSFLWSDRGVKDMIPSVAATFFGVAYFGLLGVYFFRLRELPNGSWHLLLVFAATWAYDTGGFFVGGRWGRHKLAPQASPKKSWEGCAGGVALAFLALAGLWAWVPFFHGFFTLADMAVLAVLLSVFGQLGDLVESAIKRSLNAKDSGSFFPGHGGLFDRIDSLLFNAPLLFYYLSLFKH
ncbi:MAG TPA: phosphatidate cytidylyltransferase [bacterium]|nr:phosphatidate cytidylyltransferase [bacterium]